MFRKISHVAIAVKNLDEAIKTFSELTGIENYHIETRAVSFGFGGCDLTK